MDVGFDRSMKKSLIWSLKAFVSLGILWYLASDIDWAQVWGLLGKLGWPSLVLAAGLFLIQLTFGAVRWSLIAASIGAYLPWRRAFSLQYIGLFFNLVLPGIVGGDAIRIWQAHKAGMSLGDAFTSVTLERVVTILGVAMMIAFSLPFLFERVGDEIVRTVLSLSVLGILAGTGLLVFLDRMPRTIAHWRVVRGLGKLAGDTRRLFVQPGPLLQVLALAIATQVALAVATYILSLDIEAKVTVWDCLIFIPPVMLVTALPISIGGWGVREITMVTTFAYVGVPVELSLAISVLFGILTLITSLPGGIYWLALKNSRQQV